eukprot:3113847-Amphidinium_carterae.1
MESEMIRHNRARKQQRIAVEGKQYTRCQHNTILSLASLIPCRPGTGKLSVHGQSCSFHLDHYQKEAATSAKKEHDEMRALFV